MSNKAQKTASNKAPQVTAESLLQLLQGNQFDAETSEIIRDALSRKSSVLPVTVVPPTGKIPCGLVQIGAYRNENFKFKPKNLSPRLVREVVKLCETAEGRQRLIDVCDEADKATEAAKSGK